MTDEKALWYVVHTYSGYENKVASDLVKTVENNGMGDLIQDVTVPVEEVVEIRNGKPHTIQHKLFPGYVLVKMIKTTETWYIVRNTRGVTGFVGPGSEPIPLTDEEYERMTSCQGTIRIDLEVGDSVRIKTGSVENAIGTVEEINAEEHRVKVSIEILNRKTTVEYDIGGGAPVKAPAGLNMDNPGVSPGCWECPPFRRAEARRSRRAAAGRGRNDPFRVTTDLGGLIPWLRKLLA